MKHFLVQCIRIFNEQKENSDQFLILFTDKKLMKISTILGHHTRIVP